MSKSIAVVGAGSIGLYYGGKLAAHGYEVKFLMRSGYEEARRDGIRIFSPDSGDVTVKEPLVYRTAEEIGPVGMVMIALKATANKTLETLLPPLLDKETLLFTLQNGLGNDEFLAERFGAERVLGALCFIGITRRSAACVNHVGKAYMSIGEFGRPSLPRTRELARAFEQSGTTAEVVENLAAERWKKLVWNIPFNGLAVAEGGVTTDRILADPSLRARCRGLMSEVIAVSTALGYPLTEDYADYKISRTVPLGNYKPSTLIDWQAGQELEVEPIWGEPLRRAKAAGIPTPLLEELYARLSQRNGAKQSS